MIIVLFRYYIGRDVNGAQVEELILYNKWVTISNLSSALELFSRAVHNQISDGRTQKISIFRLLFYIFSGLKKDMSSWNPQWQAVRYGCIISLKQYRLKCSGNTQILWDANSLKSVSVLEKLWHLFSWIQRNHPHRISCLGAQQSMWMPYKTWCDHLMRLFAGRDLDICHEMWSFIVTLQLHTAHIRHKLL